MPSASIPTLQVQKTDMGLSPVSNPTSLILKINGVLYGDSYDLETTNYTRRIFPVYDSTDQHIYLQSIDYAHGSDMPTTNLTNVEVLIVA